MDREGGVMELSVEEMCGVELGVRAERSISYVPQGEIAKVRYSHKDMIDFIIAHPGVSQNTLAARYGYSAGWVCQVMSSDAWKAAMAARREEMIDPVLLATVRERFEGISMLSLARLQEKLEAPQVSDNVVLKAVELGAKAMGLGGNTPPPPPLHTADHLAQLANRLIDLQSQIRGRTIEGEVA